MTDPPSVLVVADDPAICGLLARLLSAQGYAVRLACDAGTMRAAAGDEPPDLLLFDRFPAHPGALLLAQGLRQRFPHLPILGFSPRFDHGDAPGVPFLPMPFARGQLEAEVANALRGGHDAPS